MVRTVAEIRRIALANSIAAFRLKMRKETLAIPPTASPQQVQEKISLAREIADVLLRNVVQAVKLDGPTRGPSDYERFSESVTTMQVGQTLI